MKKTLITILLLSTLIANAQQERRQFGIIEVFRGGDSLFIKKLVTNVVNVTDGLITKTRTPPDTATLYLPTEGAVYEGVTTWRKVVISKPVVVTTVDNDKATYSTSPKWSYNGPIKNSDGTPVAGWFLGTGAFSNVVGSTATLDFVGNKIEMWAELKPSHGSGTITIDNGAPIPVSFIGASKVPVLIYTSPTLEQGQHTIKLTVVFGYCLIDYFKIYSQQ